MRSAHSVDEVRRAEGALLEVLSAGVLMERAATGLAFAVLDLLGRGYGSRVLLLVGSGDNGGDALFAGARLARRGVAVEALLLSPTRTHPAGLRAFSHAGGRVVPDVASAHRPDVVVDGIVGIGGSGGLRPEAAEAVERLRGCVFVAVDVPSGVDVDTGEVHGAHVEADVTVTFGTHKAAHLVDPAARACGAVHLVDLGLDLPEARLTALQADDVAALLPRPDPAAHKYSRGVVGVRAGSAEYPGAGALCVAGASSGFAGMVRYEDVGGAVGGAEPSGVGSAEHRGVAARAVLHRHPEVVVGPGRVQAWVVGSGGGAGAGEALRRSVEDGVPVVVDADGLTQLTGSVDVPLLLTPHAGELARMLGVAREEVETGQLRFAKQAAARYDAVVLLKGRHTLVAAPDGRVRVSTTGTPWLATAGSGDVLAGLCGALLAAGLDPFDAGSVGAWLHGAAAVVAGDGGPVSAPQVAAALADVARDLTRHR
jgi:hydroxyethylthiazole kinase-like uncharacterized protein yjeF